MAIASAMYHSELNPLKKITRDGETVKTPRSGKQRKLHKAFLRYHDPKNWGVLRQALKKMGRSDLIGHGEEHLVPYSGASSNGVTSQRSCTTSHDFHHRIPVKKDPKKTKGKKLFTKKVRRKRR
jgi:hypothetical protein